MFICEYAHSMGNAIGNLPEYWDFIENSNATAGGCIWDWVDQAIYDPAEIKAGTYAGRLHTGYDYPGPHQGNFCSNGIITANREETPKLKEVKGAYEYVDFELVSIDREHRYVTISVRDKYNFTNLCEFDLQMQTLIDGKVVKKSVRTMPDVAPGASTMLTLKFPRSKMKMEEMLVNLALVRRNATRWCAAGHVEAIEQFIIEKRMQEQSAENTTASKEILKPNTKTVVAPADIKIPSLRVAGDTIVVHNKKVTAKFCAKSGALLSLRMRGHDIMEGGSLVYDNHRWIENDRYKQTDAQNDSDAEISYAVNRENRSLDLYVKRGGKLCSTVVTYSFYNNGKIDVEAEFTPSDGNLRRAGLLSYVNAEYGNVDYYAYGPWENYNDRKAGVLPGRYKATVDNMSGNYVKPQSGGNREGLRELSLTNSDGAGLNIKVLSGDCSFSALRYTDAALMNANHLWQAEKSPYIVLHLDAAVRGVGNASCGYDVDTIEKYRVPNKTMKYKLRLSFVK